MLCKIFPYLIIAISFFITKKSSIVKSTSQEVSCVILMLDKCHDKLFKNFTKFLFYLWWKKLKSYVQGAVCSNILYIVDNQNY